MVSVIIVILFAFFAKGLSADNLFNKLVTKLFDRALTVSPLLGADLVDSSLGRFNHQAVSLHRNHAFRTSRFRARYLRGRRFQPIPNAGVQASTRRSSMKQVIASLPSKFVEARQAKATSPVSALAATAAVQAGQVMETRPNNDDVTEENPLRVLIAGAGVGGLALATSLVKDPKIKVTVLEKTDRFQRFGGPIQLASNALQVLKEMDKAVFDQIMEKFTFTGNLVNGIKDGIRNEWYVKFDLKNPAQDRNMPFTGVIDRPDLQEIYLKSLPAGTIQNGDAVVRYESNPGGHGVKAFLQSGVVVEGDVLIGADGIWSSVRSSMRNQPTRGDGSDVAYSGYTCFAGDLVYKSFDNGEVGYKVYIGPEQYFVVSDVGKGRYQWYAFLSRQPGSAETEPKPDGQIAFLKKIFKGWSKEIHDLLDATQEQEIGQRDLYDLPPSVWKPWTEGSTALLGDSIHAMMPNLGQGGCQAIEDAFVISQELKSVKSRAEIASKLQRYRSRRLVRVATVHGLSRLASDLIINVFDTPAKIVMDGGLKFENFNFPGLVTRVIQPLMPLIFSLQFNFLYESWRNEWLVR